MAGLYVALGSIVALLLLSRWRAPYRMRAGTFVGIGCVASAIVMFNEGFSPAQCVIWCFVTMLSAIFFSLRAAAAVVALHVLLMLAAAYLFSHGQLTPINLDHVDVHLLGVLGRRTDRARHRQRRVQAARQAVHARTTAGGGAGGARTCPRRAERTTHCHADDLT